MFQEQFLLPLEQVIDVQRDDSIGDWVWAAKSAAPASLVSKELPLEEQVRQLKKENDRLRMEREILKKATAFFAKEHP